MDLEQPILTNQWWVAQNGLYLVWTCQNLPLGEIVSLQSRSNSQGNLRWLEVVATRMNATNYSCRIATGYVFLLNNVSLLTSDSLADPSSSDCQLSRYHRLLGEV